MSIKGGTGIHHKGHDIISHRGYSSNIRITLKFDMHFGGGNLDPFNFDPNFDQNMLIGYLAIW